MSDQDLASALEGLRREIAGIDTDILRLVAARVTAAREIGRQKQQSGVPLRDWEVERQVLERAAALAGPLGLPAGAVRSLMGVLIEAAREEQEATSYATYRGPQESILVVGGLGKMGRWFVDFLGNQGHRVAVWDTAAPGAAGLGEAIGEASMAVLAVAPEAVAGILDELARRQYRGTVFDIASLKAHLRPAITRARQAGLAVTSLHPMFGPGTRALSGRVICICDCGDPVATRRAEALFTDTAASLVHLSLEEHDRAVSYVLGLSHLLNLLFAKVLANSGTAFDHLNRVGSTTFHAQIGTTATVVGEDPALYFAIQRLNPFTPEIYEAVRRELEELTGWVLTGDRASFSAMMEQARDWMGLPSGPSPGRE
jgi:chorismate mutase/prephenate dehydrogenase